ncbi:MAG: PcfJ domain-containing protein, partial [Actinobacteria bacterium]|nr:PcfJ domain-containing protein [Actinomycetota bacterium]
RRLTDATAIPHPPSLRSIDGTTCGTFTLVLPRTCGDLIRWSRLLRNCLDTYTAAAVGGASHLIGVECDGSLRYVIEVTPQRGIRQFTGHANRPPTRADHDALVDHLRAHAVVG